MLSLLNLGLHSKFLILHQQIQIDNAVRAGARHGAVGYGNEQIIQIVKDECSFAVLDTEITIEVFNVNGDSVGDSEDRTPSYQIRVRVDIDGENIVLAIPYTIPLHAESEFRIE